MDSRKYIHLAKYPQLTIDEKRKRIITCLRRQVEDWEESKCPRRLLGHFE